MSISNRDLEALSAYLDGELSGKELKNLEANLRSDEELRNALAALQQTKTIIRSLPSLSAPRNYYLTPAMVGEKRKPLHMFPVLRFASVLATLLLVLLFLGDFFVLPSQVMAPERTMQLAEPAAEEAEKMEYEAETIEGQLPEIPAEESLDLSEMEREAAAPLAEALISPSVEPTPGIEELPAAELPAPAEESMDRLEMEVEPAPPEAEGIIRPSIQATPGLEEKMVTEKPAPAEAMEDVVGGVSEPEEAPDLRIETPEPPEQLEIRPRPWINYRTAIRITEFVLIFIAITTGLAAFFLYLKNR
jgi:hypothetical protein